MVNCLILLPEVVNDLIYLNRHTKHAIFVPPNAEVTWNGKKI